MSQDTHHVSAEGVVESALATTEMAATLKAHLPTRSPWIFWAGNGGCASIADHMAAELVSGFGGRYRPRRSMSLSSNASLLTSLANDLGFVHAYSHIANVICSRGDLLILLSTSGRSRNLCSAARQALEHGVYVVSITGDRRSDLSSASDLAIEIGTPEVDRIQDGQQAVCHLLCKIILESNR